jgi:signal peptidase II
MRYGYAIAAFSVIAMDQLTKLLIRLFMPIGEGVQVIPYVLRITHVENTGAGFSILRGQNTALIFVMLTIIGALMFYFDRFKGNEKWFVAIIIGGAAGNLIDRILLGHVTDFMDITIWPVFNLADSCVTLGVCGLLYLALKD